MRRFWKNVDVCKTAGGWHVLLDGRVLKSPSKESVLAPTRALGLLVAAEWDMATTVI